MLTLQLSRRRFQCDDFNSTILIALFGDMKSSNWNRTIKIAQLKSSKLVCCDCTQLEPQCIHVDVRSIVHALWHKLHTVTTHKFRQFQLCDFNCAISIRRFHVSKKRNWNHRIEIVALKSLTRWLQRWHLWPFSWNWLTNFPHLTQSPPTDSCHTGSLASQWSDVMRKNDNITWNQMGPNAVAPKALVFGIFGAMTDRRNSTAMTQNLEVWGVQSKIEVSSTCSHSVRVGKIQTRFIRPF